MSFLLEASQFITLIGTGFTVRTPINTLFNRVFQDHCSCPNYAFWSYCYPITQSRVHTYEAIVANFHFAGNYSVTGDKAVVTYRRVMTDMIATPNNHIAANLDKRLDNIRLENEAVIPHVDIAPMDCLRIYITDHLIAFALAAVIDFSAESIDSLKADSDKHRVGIGRVKFMYPLEGYNGQSKERWLIDVLFIDCEGYHLIVAVLCQINMGYLGKVASAEEN